MHQATRMRPLEAARRLLDLEAPTLRYVNEILWEPMEINEKSMKINDFHWILMILLISNGFYWFLLNLVQAIDSGASRGRARPREDAFASPDASAVAPVSPQCCTNALGRPEKPLKNRKFGISTWAHFNIYIYKALYSIQTILQYSNCKGYPDVR